jgi:bifunctional non-homologous end joining protein LigD
MIKTTAVAETAPPGFVEPQLPTLVERPPEGDGWLHEIKYDGYRTQVVVDGPNVRAFTRNGHDWTAKYPRIISAASQIACRSAVIDGEAIVQDERGVSHFGLLRKALFSAPGKIVMFAFDLLHLDGRDLRALPLDERRGLLRDLLSGRDGTFPIRFSEEFGGSGAELFVAADAHGLEGVVSKRRGSRYRSGRSDGWLKAKCFTESVLDVIGLERTDTGAVTALLADAEEDGRMHYAGKAFLNLGGRERDVFRRRIEGRQADRPPPGIPKRPKAAWIDARVPVRVRHLKGEEGLRHASIVGLADGPAEMHR